MGQCGKESQLCEVNKYLLSNFEPSYVGKTYKPENFRIGPNKDWLTL